MRKTRKNMVGKIEDHEHEEREEGYRKLEGELHQQAQINLVSGSANGRIRQRRRSRRTAPQERITLRSGVLPARSANHEDYVPQGDGL